MATTKVKRGELLSELERKFDAWEKMNDQELLGELQKAMFCNVTSKSRHQTVKYLVYYHVKKMV